MESGARRRLDSIARHLLVPRIISLNHVGGAEERNYVGSNPVIIGGMVLDIHAKPCSDPIPGTTTPGKVQYVSGGVARNISECMSKLGSKPFIISVVGHDMAGDQLLKYWRSAGLCMEGILKSKGVSTPVVSNLFDCDGELAGAVASVDAVEAYLTPDWIRQFVRNIYSAQVLIVDANLCPQSLEVSCQIAAEYGTPVWFEPVSITKSRRIVSIINYVTCTSPNENELIAMASALSPGQEFNLINSNGRGQSVQSLFELLKPAILCLLDKGIKMLVVTLGSDGAFLCSKERLDFLKEAFKKGKRNRGGKLYELVNRICPLRQSRSSMKFEMACPHFYAFHFPALPVSVVSLTGAGDCLVGGMLASICCGLDVMQSMAVGIAVAKAAVAAELNVPTEFNMASIADDTKQVFWGAKPLIVD